MVQQRDDRSAEMGSVRLAIAFSIFVSMSFFAFIALGIFSPNTLAAPALSTQKISVGLVYGLVIIASSAVTTLLYVFHANHTARRLDF